MCIFKSLLNKARFWNDEQLKGGIESIMQTLKLFQQFKMDVWRYFLTVN